MPGFLIVGLTSDNWLKTNETAHQMFLPMKCAFFPSGRSRGALGEREKPWEVRIAQAAAVSLQGALGSPEVPVTSPRAAQLLVSPGPSVSWAVPAVKAPRRETWSSPGEPDQKQVVPTRSVTVEKQILLLCITALHSSKSDLRRGTGSIP